MYHVRYQVAFVNAINEVVTTQVIKKGEEIIYPTDEEMYVEGYRFLSTFDYDGSEITSNIVIRGNYAKQWTVNFYNGINELIYTVTVEDGAKITAPDESLYQMEGYIFKGWDKQFNTATSDLNIYGIYEKEGTTCKHNIVAATCTKAEYCSICKEEFGLPLDHNYYEIVVEPTCDTEGYTKHVCATCNDTYIDNYVNQLEHIESDWIIENEATCTEEGLKYIECTLCQEKLTTETIPTIPHNYENNVCTMCGNPQSSFKPTVYEENGTKFINMGRYPQTVVDDENIISALSTITTTNELGYIEYNGEEYKQLTVDTYYSGSTFNNGNTIIEGNIYYFKVEPIKWRVLYIEGNSYTLLCEMLLDNTNYYHTHDENRIINGSTIYPNNYKYSNVRAWLNGYDGSSYNVDNYTNKGFYDIAFNEVEKQFTQTTLVDNSLETTGYSSNRYVCENTNDKLYLLSYKDVTNTLYGFSSSNSSSGTREAQTTDYARSKDCWMDTSVTYYGNGLWWLRSPYDYNSNSERFVNTVGHVNSSGVYNSYIGVRAAMTIVME